MKVCLDEIKQNSPAINQVELPGNVVSPKVMQWLENTPEIPALLVTAVLFSNAPSPALIYPSLGRHPIANHPTSPWLPVPSTSHFS